MTVWMSHGDTVLAPPAGLHSLAATDNCPVAAMADPARRLFAVQFHPEVAHTPQGKTILENFLFDLAGLEPTGPCRRSSTRRSTASGAQVGTERVLCALSGGVDSSVAAALIHRGDRRPAHVRLRRQRPPAEGRGRARSCATFRDAFKMNLIHVDASKRFMDRLDGVTDPEEKRKTIGAEFIAVFEEEARRARARSRSWPRARSIRT